MKSLASLKQDLAALKTPADRLAVALELLRAVGPQLSPVHRSLIEVSAHSLQLVLEAVHGDGQLDARLAVANRHAEAEMRINSKTGGGR